MSITGCQRHYLDVFWMFGRALYIIFTICRDETAQMTPSQHSRTRGNTFSEWMSAREGLVQLSLDQPAIQPTRSQSSPTLHLSLSSVHAWIWVRTRSLRLSGYLFFDKMRWNESGCGAVGVRRSPPSPLPLATRRSCIFHIRMFPFCSLCCLCAKANPPFHAKPSAATQSNATQTLGARHRRRAILL